MSKRCDSFHWQYRCQKDANHTGQHRTVGDDCTVYEWPRPECALPWSTIEEIATYVQGDGTDPQRVALADGIREGRK